MLELTLKNPPSGYEAQAEYRIPRPGEHVLDSRRLGGTTIVVIHPTDVRHTVLKPVKRWHKANMDDLIKVMLGKTVVARFRDNDTEQWFESSLIGYIAYDVPHWVRRGGKSFAQCEVLDGQDL